MIVRGFIVSIAILAMTPQPLAVETFHVEPSQAVPGWEHYPPRYQPVVDEVELSVQDVVMVVLSSIGRSEEYDCLAGIFEGESSWNPEARGDGGDSYGLPQRHAPSHGAPELPWPVEEQVLWSLAYADERYGGACEAWQVWQTRRWW